MNFRKKSTPLQTSPHERGGSIRNPELCNTQIRNLSFNIRAKEKQTSKETKQSYKSQKPPVANLTKNHPPVSCGPRARKTHGIRQNADS